MYKIKVLHVFLFLIINTCFKAQVLKFKQYTTKDGLFSDDVFNLHQDTKGYLWLFTNYGAMKYNGKTFEPVLKNLTFNESFIFSFYENKNGAKWAANSNAKIFEIKNDSAFVVKGTEKVSQTLRESVSEIFQLYIDENENIYACTKSDSYKFIKNKNYQSSNLNQKIQSDSILHCALEINNNILSIINYAGKGISGFYLGRPYLKIKFIDGNKKDTTFSIKCMVPSTPKCFKRFDSGIYFSFYDKIVHINRNNKVKEVPINSVILNFTKDKNNHLWVACYTDGLYEFNENDSLINHYFENKTINYVLCDSQNGLWVSSSGYGLFHCENLDEVHFINNVFFGKPISFIKHLNNTIFVANNFGDVFSFKNNVFKKISKDKTILGEPLDIIETKDSYIVSSRLNTVRISKFYNNRTTEFSPNNLAQHFYSYKMKIKGTDTLICLQRKDVIMLLGNKVVLQIPSKYKLHDIEVRNNVILVATDNGVYQIVNNKLFQPIFLNPTKNCIITKICKDNDSNYWFCSKGSGVFKLSPENKLVNYTTLNFLPSNIINDISFVPDTGILLSTNKGLYYSDISLILNSWNSIYPEEVNSSTFYNNKLYLATKNGLVILDQKKLDSKQSLFFNISSVSVNSEPINFKALKNLNYFENSIEFNFDLILYASSPPSINYKLIGREKYSGTVKNQQINFQSLSPGSYTLIAVPDIYGNEKYKISILFNIIPAFWQTNWFIVLCVLLIVVITCLIIWFTIKYRKTKENKKNEVNRLVLEYKLIALKAQINPHFMSNCLTAIQHLIISNKVDEANQYIAKFSFLVRQVLNFSTKSMVSLKEELEITELNIELEQLRFENKFDFEISWEDSIDLKNMLVPPLILQPIVENAIWHGLLPLKNSRKGKLLIKISLLNDSLVIIVEDNGFGRKIGNKNIGNLRESKGIQIIKQRILNMNNLYNTNKGDFIIEDLTDGLSNSIGTRVTFILPLITIH